MLRAGLEREVLRMREGPLPFGDAQGWLGEGGVAHVRENRDRLP